MSLNRRIDRAPPITAAEQSSIEAILGYDPDDVWSRARHPPFVIAGEVLTRKHPVIVRVRVTVRVGVRVRSRSIRSLLGLGLGLQVSGHR